uniref:Cilia- and flagella-associated protein 97 n=1 Tax=Chrysotila carterae TaxID=13221 RepID=A0A7S4BL49_CHRCT
MPYEPRGMWCSNHICGERELQRRQAIHHARIQQMKPMVDQRDPRRRMNVNSKAARQNEERNAQIFYENSLLLDKLSKILTRPNSAAAQRTPSFPGTEKLHEAYRKQERDRIHRENQALLRRLQYSKPCIDTAAFEEHWQQQANFAAKTRSLQANPNLPQPRPRVPGSNSDILPRRQRPFSTGDMERARRNAFESKSVGTSVKYTSSYKIGDNYSNNGGGDYARGGRHGGDSGGGRGGAGAGAATAGSERRRGSAPSLLHGLGEAPLTIPEEASEAAESIGHDAVQGAEQPDAGSKAAAGAAEAASVRYLTRAEMDARVGAAVEAEGGAGDQAECVGGD